MTHVGISYWKTGGDQTKQRVFRSLADSVTVTLLDPTTDHTDLDTCGFDFYHLAKRRDASLRDLHRAAHAGIPTLNPPFSVALTSDRVATLDVLSQGGVPVPTYQYGPASEVTLPPPVIVKTLHETDAAAHDHDVFFEESPTFAGTRLIQQYLPKARHLKVYRVGSAIRVVELGTGRGVVARELNATAPLIALTDRIAALTGLSLFEVDVLDGPVPMVVDVNPVVSLNGVADAERVYLAFLLSQLRRVVPQSEAQAAVSLD
ncbi:hypothetical protein [Haladaptatus sp. DJG-WS-42]|uniref:ATP-grasp domain-containing protein n=1 Tax=Haladaptatus sp. DJG-WS-42 TaxID=3120516 RepID=UPI0030CC9A7F